MKKFTKLTLLAGAMTMIALQGTNAQSFKGDGLNGSYFRCKASTLKAWQALGKMDKINVDVFDSTAVGTMKAPSGSTFDYNFSDAINAFKNSFPYKNDDWFSARFEGFLRAPISGEYTFSGIGDNGFRIYVNDVLVLDHWIGDWETKVSGAQTIKLAGGSYNKIKIEFAEYVGGQFLKLFYSAPGLAEEVIPKNNLFSEIPMANSLSGTYYRFTQATIDSLNKNRPNDYQNIDYYKNYSQTLQMFDGVKVGSVPTAKTTGTDFRMDWGRVFDIYLPTLGSDNFASRYEGFIKSPTAGDVNFMFWGDNGCRVWVGDTLVVDHWVRDWEKLIIGKSFTMKADTTYKIKVEFFEEGGGQALELFWNYAGMTVPMNNPDRAFIPVSALSTHDIDRTKTFPGAYNGAMASLPGIITAVNFNTGGQGEGYSDKTPTNTGDGAFRTTEGVDINTLGTDKVVAAESEEWLRYTVKAADFIGAYKPTINYNSTTASKIAILVDGVSADTISLPATGLAVGDSTLKLNDKIYITAGERILQVVVVSGTPNLKSFVLDRTNSPYLGVMATIPGKVEAELFDAGGQDVAYWDNNMGHNNSGAFARFRGEEGVDIGSTWLNGDQKTPVFKTIGWNDGNEWQIYTVDVKETADYSVLFHYSSGTNKGDAKQSFYLDGNLIVDQLPVPPSGNWDIYRTTKATYKVNLTKGVHTLKAMSNTGGYDFEGVTFAIPVETIDLTPAAITTDAGTVTVASAVGPVAASDKSLTWKITGEALGATIDANTGVIKASGLPAGNGIIKVVATAKDGFGVTDTVDVTISGQFINVESIVIDPAEITVDGGDVTPTFTVLPEEAVDKSLTWTIEGANLGATIDAATGKVTASGLNNGNGEITVKATAKDGSNLSATAKITISGQIELVGIDNTNANGVNIYPNPATKYITISGVEAGTQVNIFDAAGILVKSVKLSGSTINVSNLSNGVYIVKFNDVTARIVKK